MLWVSFDPLESVAESIFVPRQEINIEISMETSRDVRQISIECQKIRDSFVTIDAKILVLYDIKRGFAHILV